MCQRRRTNTSLNVTEDKVHAKKVLEVSRPRFEVIFNRS